MKYDKFILFKTDKIIKRVGQSCLSNFANVKPIIVESNLIFLNIFRILAFNIFISSCIFSFVVSYFLGEKVFLKHIHGVTEFYQQTERSECTGKAW